LHEIGVFRRGEEMWMVLAAPFAPPAPDDAPAVSHRVLELVNEARRHARSCGRTKIPATTPLTQAAAEVVNTWLASPGHCANLMNPRYSDMGVAYAVNPDSEKVIYWAQVFAAPE
jgi:hypothetical protein